MRIAVISSGNGGQSLAAYLANQGHSVTLYAREQARVDMFPERHFSLSGQVVCETDVDLISCHMDEVISGAELIMVTTPAQYHGVIAREMAPYLTDGQVVILNPGRTFGTFTVAKALADCGCTANVILGETDTFVFTCRCKAVGHPVIYEIKHGLRVAGHDNADTPRLTALLRELFPSVEPAASVLETGLSNIGMVFHPLPILMNITRIEAKEDFRYYIDGISPLVASVLEQIDAERVAVAKAAGVAVPTAAEWLADRYGSQGDTLYERIQNTHAYQDVLAPTDIDTRYIFEDIQTGCVPVSSLGWRLGVRTDVIDAAIHWANVVYRRDFYRTGRNEDAIDFERMLSMIS